MQNIEDNMQHVKVRHTKIVCTIGPATSSPEQLKALIRAGMDVARLNFSHGDPEDHRKTIRAIRQASAELRKEVGILQDLGGPKIRLGNLQVPERRLLAGEQVALYASDNSDSDVIPVNYPHLAEDVAVGDRILLADGSVELLVKDKKGKEVICEVLAGGAISSRKGVNLPSSSLRIPAFTEKDRKDLELGLEERVDFVALSFVRHEKDLEPVRMMLDSSEHRPLLIAKIEKAQALQRLNVILDAVDGVMVARGDLGVEIPIEEVPLVQKRIISEARKAAKPVITATQMLLSMVRSPRPSRAEATDVANAILDGTDALMLSEETAVGSFPIEAIKMLDRIALTTEPSIRTRPLLEESMSELLPQTAAAISRAASWLIYDLKPAAIVASTSSGNTARLVARFRPPCPIIGLTPLVSTLRQLNLSWGVIPALIAPMVDTDRMFSAVRAWALEKGIAGSGDRLIVTSGVPVGVPGTTNLLKVIEAKP
jgi:pyruvate kinase